MKRKKVLLILIVALFYGQVVHAQTPEEKGYEIAKRSDEKRPWFLPTVLSI